MFTPILFEPARVWLSRGALDRRIARGADTRESPQLARRARQLTSRRRRRALANGIRNLVNAAEEPVRALSAAAPVQRREILHERGFLLQLAIDLESDDELNARGIALIERLLTDGASPVYSPLPAGTLRDALTHAHAALFLA
jgi:hypothetical protein